MKKIVATMDFSPASENALKWAGALARIHDAEMCVVHSLLLASHATPYVPPAPSFDHDLQQKVNGLLEQAVAGLREGGIEVEARLVHESPARAVAAICDEWRPDLVVVGTRGAGGLEHAILGSTAERIVTSASCPVLAVHPEDAAPDLPIRRVLLATDFSAESRSAAESAIELLKPAQDGELVVVHGVSLPVEYGLYEMASLPQEYLDTIEEAAEREAEKWLASLATGDWKTRVRIVRGHPYEVIALAAEEEQADFIAMGTHGHGRVAGVLLGNTARKTLQHARCPVLTVRRRD
ncbi:MAG: universal stress protein [Thermoanaerobaculia bacterium]|nr:universal stress protein [Thermoanaerobaculia bacterium]